MVKAMNQEFVDYLMNEFLNIRKVGSVEYVTDQKEARVREDIHRVPYFKISYKFIPRGDPDKLIEKNAKISSRIRSKVQHIMDGKKTIKKLFPEEIQNGMNYKDLKNSYRYVDAPDVSEDVVFHDLPGTKLFLYATKNVILSIQKP